MTTVADFPAPVSREVAVQHLASGRTAEGRRALAALPVVVNGYAAAYGVTPDEIRGAFLGIAAGIDLVTGRTPDCPAVTDGGSHSISWHQGGTCAFCGATS
jgi:hypothetical protein